ncbi:phosphatase PAP2 family protein [Microvirga vignae]|uniref:phosphatase PAP2 family protein n=1 Tax=Microvirga vignae TaxID=1225564 RepID=UPI00069C2C6F|nr:phosphatase PAP2 family protein [Microvirga vignae]
MTDDRILYGVVGVYLLVAACLTIALGYPERLVAFIYLPHWLHGLVVTITLYSVVWGIRSDPRRPLTAVYRGLSTLPLPRLVAGGVLFCSVAVFSGTFTSIKTMLPDFVPFWADLSLADLDAALHGGVAPWFVLQPILGYPAVTRVIEYAYGPACAFTAYGFTAFVAIHPAASHLRTRFFLAFFGAWILLGNILAATGMSVGPAYYDLITGDIERFHGLVQYLSFSEGLPFSAWSYQKYLWTNHVAGTVELGTGISAFPSLHVAMSTLFALAAWRINRWVGVVLTLFWGVVLVGSVHLGWHYALDGYVSTACMLAIWFGAGRLHRLLQSPALP